MFAIVGLGNPGKLYEGTRHNVGFDVIDLLADRNNIRINKIKFKSIYGEMLDYISVLNMEDVAQ